MADVNPDLLFKADRTYIEVMLDHLNRDAALSSPNKNYVRVDRRELERIMVTYCSRIRQQTQDEIYRLWNKQPPTPIEQGEQ